MATKTVKRTGTKSKLRANEEKWTKPLMDAGWTAVPSIILEKQETLGLDAIDINIILHLAMYWWRADNKPHPPKATIAKALQLHPRTIQKRIAAMEQLGFLRREFRKDDVKGNDTNLYYLDGLIKEATPYALEKLDMKAKNRAANMHRIASKRRPKASAN